MKESDFISQNRDKWRKADLPNLTITEDYYDLYNEVSNDSAYAQTRYKNRSVRVYLNHLLVKLQGKIINKRKDREDSLLYYWKYQVPKAMHESRFHLLLCFIIFSFCMLMGYYSSMSDANFFEEFFGSRYTTTTIQNIEKGDPLAIYKDEDAMSMFLSIGFNNLKVGFFAFALGCLFGIGSLFMMIINGIMLGAFMEFFISKGLAAEFTFTVWMHGTFEIAMLIIVASAGFTMGYGLIQKGHYSRLQSFYRSSRRGITILVATVPFTILAALIESFITRYTEIPNVVRGSFIITCFLVTLWYFVVYPLYLAKRNRFKKDERVLPAKLAADKQDYRRFQNSMHLAIQSLHQLWREILIGVIILISSFFVVNNLLELQLVESIQHITAFNLKGSQFINLFTGLALLPNNLKMILGSVDWLYLGAPVSIFVIWLGNQSLNKGRLNIPKAILQWGIFTLYWFVIYKGNTFTTFACTPLFISLLVSIQIEKEGKKVIGNAIKYGLLNSQVWFSFFTSVLLTYLITYLLHSPLFWTLLEIVQLFIAKDNIAFASMSKWVLFTFTQLTLIIFLILYYLNVLSNYKYKQEKVELSELEEAIKNLKPSKRILGYEVE